MNKNFESSDTPEHGKVIVIRRDAETQVVTVWIKDTSSSHGHQERGVGKNVCSAIGDMVTKFPESFGIEEFEELPIDVIPLAKMP